jgi:hypothetical protein
MTHGDLDQWRALRRAVGDARLLGSVFALVGALFLIPLLRRSDGLLERMLTLSASLLLLAPGILYWVAAQSLHRRKPAGAVLARRAAAAHLIAIVGCLGIGSLAGTWDTWGPRGYALFFPGIIALFFVPALIAFLAQTRAALRAAKQLDDTGRAFEPLVAQPIARTQGVQAPPGEAPPT